MSQLAALAGTVVQPAVAAGSLLVWVPAAVLATLAQTDRPSGPAPRADPLAARAALALAGLGIALAIGQAVVAVASLAGWAAAPVAAFTWPALAASVTAAALVLAGGVAPLRRLREGRAITDTGQLRRMHASLRTAVVAGALAAVAVVLGAGMAPAHGATGPYVAPVALVAAVVLTAHATLRTGVLSR